MPPPSLFCRLARSGPRRAEAEERRAGGGPAPGPTPAPGRRWFSPALHKSPLRRSMCAGGAEKRAGGRAAGWMSWREAVHFSPARRQPRHVLRVPRPRGGQQLPHVLLQRQDGKGGRLCLGAAVGAGQPCWAAGRSSGKIQVHRAGVTPRVRR